MLRTLQAIQANLHNLLIALVLVLPACSAVDAPVSSGSEAAATSQPLVNLPNCPEDLSSASVRVYCLFNSAVLLRDAGYLAEAQQEFIKVLEVDPEHLLAQQYLGDIYFQAGELELAGQMYRGVIAVDGSSALAHENLGVVYDLAGETDLAISSYVEAIRLRASNAETHYKLGLAYTRDRTTMNQAIAAFEQAISLDADKANYHFDLAQVYEYIGRKARAESHYQRAADLGYP